jgi:hypothetical protein
MDTDQKIDRLTALVEKLTITQRSPWLTIQEAAAYGRMGESTIVRAIEQLLLPSYLPPAKDENGKRRAMSKRLIHRDDLDRFIRNETGRGARRRLSHEIS